MAEILRGNIWWAELDPTREREQAGTRPVLIISQPQAAGFPLTLELTSARLPHRSWVRISQIRTLSVKRLSNRLGAVSPELLDQIITGLNEIVADWIPA